MKFFWLVLLSFIVWVNRVSAQSYKSPFLPIEQRVQDLLSRMTLEEKVAELRSTWSAHPRIDVGLLANPTKMDSLFDHGMGMINPDFDNTVVQGIEYRNQIQAYLRTQTRLGIPAIFLDEAHHGVLVPKADAFPTSISLACSWDTALARQIYSTIALQASARGTGMVLAPVVDPARDPRWGRTSETYGEDPFLCGMMGSAAVQGYQGSNDGTIAPGHVAATLKHFTGHGQPEGGQNQGPADYSVRALREFHMEPFRLCIKNAHPAAIMASYDEVDEVPSHANHWLLTEVLRSEWHYKGLVVSDWWGIDQLYQKHRVAENVTDAALQAFTAGVTVDLPMGTNYAQLVALVREGKISEAAIDSAVVKVLRLKFQLGLFDRKPIDPAAVEAQIGLMAPRVLALKAAEESIVLLKNEHHILPLSLGQYKKIVVIGPTAGANYLGDYSGLPVRNPSLVDALREKVGSRSEILYAVGCNITSNGDTISYDNYQTTDRAVFPSEAENKQLLDEAIQTAKASDLIILAVGENEVLVREAEAPNHPGDASDLNLTGNQEALAKAMLSLGKPVVVVLTHGRPLSINYISEHADAILDGWFCGEEGAAAYANILFGDVNPSGKLTISVPRSVGQLPDYYNHKPSAQFLDYVNEKCTPLYPFGYGLSYTTFRYGPPRLSSHSLRPDGSVQTSVEVTNTGSRAGDEIVQLYVHKKVASVVRPVKELKGFVRLHLEPGATKTVSFTITPDMLAFWTRDMEYKAEPGVYEIMVGPNSDAGQATDLTVGSHE